MRSSRRRRGAVLIVVMGVLFVLALLATTFAGMQSLERQVAKNYLDGVRAKLIARSGVEMAYGRLMEALASGDLGRPQFLKAMRYYGTDNSEGSVPAGWTAPIENATSPSFALETNIAGNAFAGLETPQNPVDPTLFTPRNIWLLTPAQSTPIQVGFSGLMENGTYAMNGDFYALNIRDSSGMIYVNDGVTESQSYGSVTKNLRRVLNRLGDTVGVAGLGNTIVTNRPPGGYKTKRELLTVLGTATYQKVAPFVTCYGWVDRNVPNPVPLSNDPGVLAYYNSWYSSIGCTVATAAPGPGLIYFRGPTPRFRFGRGKDKDGNLLPPPNNRLMLAGNGPGLLPGSSNQNAIFGMDELFPQWIEMTGRAPVNLNSASYEVLQALLADVHGFWVCERRRDSAPASPIDGYGASTFNMIYHDYNLSNFDCDEFGNLYTSIPILPPPASGPNSAAWIARELIACRERAVSPNTGVNYANLPFSGPFRSWRQFAMFCDSLVDNNVLQDNRALTGMFSFHDPSASGNSYGYAPLITSGYQTQIYSRIGAQAMADAIKANFNPNLHLNEANPDENMTQLIDKTDLIVMSTEGAFFPTGYLEIESLGRVTRVPNSATPNTLSTTLAAPAELVAEFKIEAVVKLYEAVRFTTQRDFYGYGSNPPS